MGWGRLVRMLTLEAQKQRDRKSRFSVIALSVLSLLYMPLTVRCFRFFQCIRIDDKDYLMADFREECYTTTWLGFIFIFIAVCVIVMYCLLFPMGIFYTLFKIRKNLDSLHVRHKYGFLYNQYKLPSYWWESAAILRKLLLASVPVFMHEHPILQLTISIVVSIIFHLLHSTWHPYELYNANLLQHLTFAGTWLTFFLLLLQWNFRDQGYEHTAQYVVEGTIGFNISILVAAVYIICNTIRTEIRLLKTRVEVDITISKSLTSSLKGKLNKIAKRSKAHVKARQLEIEAEKARHAADKHGGNHSKRWNKLSLMTKLGGMAKSSSRNNHVVGSHLEHETTENFADRMVRQASVHHKQRRASLAIAQTNGREKIMERLKLRAKAKKAKVLDKVEMFKNLSTKSKNALIMKMEPSKYVLDEALCLQGKDADCLFVLVEGTAKCMVMFDGVGEQEVHRFNPLDVFGESAVKEERSVRTASIIATSDICKTIQLTRDKYFQLQKDGKLEAKSVLDLVGMVKKDGETGELQTTKGLQETLALQAKANEENHKVLLARLKAMRGDNGAPPPPGQKSTEPPIQSKSPGQTSLPPPPGQKSTEPPIQSKLPGQKISPPPQPNTKPGGSNFIKSMPRPPPTMKPPTKTDTAPIDVPGSGSTDIGHHKPGRTLNNGVVGEKKKSLTGGPGGAGQKVTRTLSSIKKDLTKIQPTITKPTLKKKDTAVAL